MILLIDIALLAVLYLFGFLSVFLGIVLLTKFLLK